MEKSAVEKTISFSCKLTQNAVLTCATDGTFVFVTEDSIYIMKLDTSSGQTDFCFITSQIVHDADRFSFDIGIDADQLKQNCTSDEWNTLALKKLVNSSQISEDCLSPREFKTAKLSNNGMDQHNRALLATLNCDGRLRILSKGRKKHEWNKVLLLSDKWHSHIKSTQYNLISDRLNNPVNGTKEFQKYVNIMDALIATDLSWSGIYDDVTDARFALLVVTYKSGHVAVWKMAVPLRGGEDASLLGVIDCSVPHPSRVCVCNIQGKPVLVVGHMSGMIQAFKLNLEDENFNHEISEPIWADADMISITGLLWVDKMATVAAIKGPYIILSRITSTKSGLAFQTSHKFLGGSMQLTGLSYVEGYIYVGLSTGGAFRGRFDNGEFHFESLSLPCARKGWQSHGLAVSQNGVYLMTVQSPSAYYDHLSLKQPIELYILRLKTVDEVCENLLDESMHNRQLSCFYDYLMYIRSYYNQTSMIPETLDHLKEKVQDMKNLPLFHLKLLRYIFEMQIANPPASIKQEEQLFNVTMKSNNMIYKNLMEELIRRHVVSSVKRFNKSVQLTDSDQTSLGLMKAFVSAYEESSTESLSSLERLDLAQPTESCIICQSQISFSNVRQDSCPNGHQFGRCCKSLLLCQQTNYRKCSDCNVLSISKQSLGELFKDDLQDTCTFCDGSLL